MFIMFRDKIGCVTVEVDNSGINFDDGKAFFSDANGKDYVMPMENVLTICSKY